MQTALADVLEARRDAGEDAELQQAAQPDSKNAEYEKYANAPQLTGDAQFDAWEMQETQEAKSYVK